jgi:arabinogalactan endo-1,4-beta-galactosidase
MIIKYLPTAKQGFIKQVIFDEILNRHNDMLTFYVYFIFESSEYYITDDGETLFNINPDLMNPDDDVADILKKYGVNFVDGRLFINAKKDELEKREKDFTDAIMEINSLYV